ncbi:Pentatricopeptide repeat-containing protein At5g50280, chloroplastic, partial [Linum grandiflorum]
YSACPCVFLKSLSHRYYGVVFIILRSEKNKRKADDHSILYAMAATAVTPASPFLRRAPPSSSSSSRSSYHSTSLFPIIRKPRYSAVDKQWRPSFSSFPAPHSSPSNHVSLLGEEDEAAAEEEEELSTSKGTVGETPRIGWNLPVSATVREQLGQYKGKISAAECEEVLDILTKEATNAELRMNCLYFFDWMRSQDPPLVTPRAYAKIFPILGKAARMGGELLILFNSLPQTDEFINVHVCTAAMTGFLHCGRYDDACKVFERMKQRNIHPNRVTCEIMISIMRRQGRSAKEQWDFFQRMNRRGFIWSTEVLYALIQSLCQAGLIEEAITVLGEVEKKGVTPDVAIYITLMAAYRKCGQVEEAEGLFVEMKARGVKPTFRTYDLLMDGYSQKMDPENVERLFKEMHDQGFEPDPTSYKYLFGAYGKQRKSDMAGAISRLKSAGIKLGSCTYTALIHAYAAYGCPEKGYEVLHEMQLEGLKPDIDTYTALLDGFKRAGDSNTLINVWRQMKNDGVQVKLMTLNNLVECFAKRGCYLEATDVVQEFRKLGFRPTVRTYTLLMKAYVLGGQHSELPRLWRDMLSLNLKPNPNTYLTLIYAYVRIGDFTRAFFYHEQMVESGQLPDASLYQRLKQVLATKAATMNEDGGSEF